MHKFKFKRSSMLGHQFLWFYWFDNERYGFMWDKMEEFHKLPQLFRNNNLLYFIWLNFKIEFGKC